MSSDDPKLDWLPDDPPPTPARGLKPWRLRPVVDGLAAEGNWERIRYIVVDELHEGLAGLVASPWPQVDRRGRLHFADEFDSRRVVTSSEDLSEVLREERTPIVAVDVGSSEVDKALREREVAIGDVFAARVITAPPALDMAERADIAVHPSRWLDESFRVYDITAEALELAKTQAAAALAGEISEEVLQAVKDELGEGEGPEPEDGGGPPKPTPGSDGGDDPEQDREDEPEDDRPRRRKEDDRLRQTESTLEDAGLPAWGSLPDDDKPMLAG